MTWYQYLFLGLRLILHMPGILLGLLVTGLLYFWALDKVEIRSPLVFVGVFKPWVKDVYRFSSSVGRSVFLHPHHLEGSVPVHEMVHVNQSEDCAAQAFFLAIMSLMFPWWVLWVCGPFLLVLNYVTSLLRHAKPNTTELSWFDYWGLKIMYRKSEHERAAYAQADGHPYSWLARNEN